MSCDNEKSPYVEGTENWKDTTCLKCNCTFKSPDPRRRRFCGKCSKKNSKIKADTSIGPGRMVPKGLGDYQ